MKNKVLAALMISAVLALTSCSGANPGDTAPERVSGGQTKVSAAASETTAAGGQKTASDAFRVTYNGVDIMLDMETAPVVKALGKDYVYTENPSCAYVGIDITYDYKALILYAQNKEGKELINTVEIRTDAVDCGGVKIGQTLDDVKKIYGDPSSTEEFGIVYVKNGIEMQFIADSNGKLIFILLTHEVAD